ncbi:MAG: O-antigen ligase family protein [Pirellulaceae bacterium]|nr:O-antigen ligase family protein [Pirellulaceae bacterium]
MANLGSTHSLHQSAPLGKLRLLPVHQGSIANLEQPHPTDFRVLGLILLILSSLVGLFLYSASFPLYTVIIGAGVLATAAMLASPFVALCVFAFTLYIESAIQILDDGGLSISRVVGVILTVSTFLRFSPQLISAFFQSPAWRIYILLILLLLISCTYSPNPLGGFISEVVRKSQFLLLGICFYMVFRYHFNSFKQYCFVLSLCLYVMLVIALIRGIQVEDPRFNLGGSSASTIAPLALVGSFHSLLLITLTNKKKWWTHLFLAGAILSGIYVLIQTNSRISLVGLFLAPIFVAFTPFQKIPLKIRSFLLGTIFASGILFTSTLPILLVESPQIKRRMENMYSMFSTGKISDSSTSGRVSIWKYYFKEAQKSPIWGHGVGFTHTNRTKVLNESTIATHNVYLHYFVTTGIIGLSLILLFFYCIWKEIRLIRRAHICVLLLSVLYFTCIHGMAGNTDNTKWFLLAVLPITWCCAYEKYQTSKTYFKKP